MGKHYGDVTAMVLCMAGLLFIGYQGGALSQNSELLKSEQQEVISRAVPALANHFCDLTKQEINSFSSSPSSSSAATLQLSSPATPILDLVAESLTASIPVVSQHLSANIIEDVVKHAGFFPSNAMETLQDLLEYDSTLMATTVSQLANEVALSYYQYGKDTFSNLYIIEGNVAKTISQVFGVIASVDQLSNNSEIPEQDSWLGNFLASIPATTLETAANTTAWTNGFTAMGTLFDHLSENTWKGVYYSGNDPDNGRIDWVCGGCNKAFRAIEKQAAALARAPSQNSPLTKE